MSVTIVGSFSNTNNTASTTLGLGTLPASLQDGDVGIAVVTINNATAPALTLPAHWTQLDAGTATSLSVYLITGDLLATDSSAVLSATCASSVRVSAAGLVLRTASLDNRVRVNQLTQVANLTIPAITPVRADCLQVALGGAMFASGTTPTSYTPPAGWTEDKDVATSAASTTNPAAYVTHKQLTGQAGVAQSTATITGSAVQRDVMYSVTFSSGAPGVFGDTLNTSLNRLAGTTGLDAQGAANAWAGTTGMALVGALNVKAGNTLPNYKELQGVLNQLAGTTGLGVDAAAASIIG